MWIWKKTNTSQQNHYQGGGSIAGTAVDLTEIAVGTDEDTRVGNRIEATSMQLKYWCYGPTGATATPGELEGVRIIIFQWHPATDPVGTDILQGTTSVPSVREYNVQRASEFKILFDSVHLLCAPSVSTTAPWQMSGTTYIQPRRYKFSIPQRDIGFVSNASTDGTNKIWMMLYATTDNTDKRVQCFIRTKLNFRG